MNDMEKISGATPEGLKQHTFDPTPDETGISIAPDSVSESPISGNNTNPSIRTVSGFCWFLIVSAILGSTFLYALDNTVVADVGVNVVQTLGEIEKLPWLGTAFTLSSMSTILVWSKIYALFDAKTLYLTSSIIFEVGSALCGAAPTMNSMIVGRAIAGVGASGIYIGSLTLISVNTSEQERPTYIGYIGLCWGSGFVLGPIIGGAFAESSATWRWAFYINLVLFGVFGPIILFIVPRHDPKKDQEVTMWSRAMEMDWLGSVLEIGACVPGIMAISFGGAIYAWNSGENIGLFVASGVLFVLFGLQQSFSFLTSFEGRIFPVQFMWNKDVLLLWVIIAACGAAMLGPVYFIPIYFQLVHGDTPIDAAVRLLPIIITFVAFVMIGGAAVSRTGRYWPWFFVGGILSTIGSSLLYADIDMFSPAAKIYGYSLLIGIGCGSIGQLAYSAAQFKVIPEYIPSTIGFICMGQYVGLTLALCTSGSIFLNLAQSKVAALLPGGTPVLEIRAMIQGVDKAGLAALSEDLRGQILDAVLASIQATYPVSIFGGALVIVATVLLNPFDKITFK